jgi:hypothetical protein
MGLSLSGIDMTIPTLDKTWQFNVNNIAGGNANGALDDNRHLIYLIKQALIGLSIIKSGSLYVSHVSLNWTNVWIVTLSSNAVSFGAVDYWDNTGDIIWANTGVDHSWVVLRQAVTGSEICIDCSNSNPRYATIVWSHSTGFAGGDLANRPTAADEVILINNTTWNGGTGAEFVYSASIMMSADGECTRILFRKLQFTLGFWLFDLAKDPVTNWSNPSVALAVSSSFGNASITTPEVLSEVANTVGYHGAIQMSMHMTSEGLVAGGATRSLSNVAHTLARNDFSDEWVLLPIGLYSPTTGAAGRHGQLYDIWFGADLAEYTTYPANLTNQFAQFVNVILPWNGEGLPIIG